MVDPSIIVAFILNFICIILNGFGIYCLHAQKGGNHNQRILLQNLSAIEMLKILNDYVSFTSYYIYQEWYKTNEPFFDLVEIYLQTILFFSLVVISTERLACIALNMRYRSLATKLLIKTIVISLWILSFPPALLFWITKSSNVKNHYYLFFDVLIVVLNIVAFLVIWRVCRRSQQAVFDETRSPRNQLKIGLVSFLIVTSFVICNCIPDIINNFYHTELSYNIVVVVWSLGFLSDPCVYIFLNKRTRETARNTMERIWCVDNVEQHSDQPVWTTRF